MSPQVGPLGTTGKLSIRTVSPYPPGGLWNMGEGERVCLSHVPIFALARARFRVCVCVPACVRPRVACLGPSPAGSRCRPGCQR